MAENIFKVNPRKLGDSGIEVSEIGFGAWGIGGPTPGIPAYGETNDDESEKALKTAYDCGITFFDTSDLYGLGHSEELIGKALKSVRSKICIATKGGFRGEKFQDFSPRYIRSALEASLRRLGTNYVDLYQLHSPSLETVEPVLELKSLLEELKREGKIRALGISVRTPTDGLLVVSWGFDSIQVNFNMTDQRALTNGLFEAARKHKTGIIVRTPLCYGFLTGELTESANFVSGDHRGGWSQEQRRLWAQAGKLFFNSLETHQTPAQAALRFCLSFSAVTTVIPGILKAKEARENAAASLLGPLSDKDRSRICEIYAGNIFFAQKK